MTTSQGICGWAAYGRKRAAGVTRLMRAPTGLLLLSLMLTRAGQAQSFLTLYAFTGGTDGSAPRGSLIADSSGNFYGTTLDGGAHGYGTVYELPATGGETVIYSFTGGADGANPYGSLIRDAAGDLYGTTAYGGNFSAPCPYPSLGCGVVFAVNPNGNERVLYTFTGGADGSNPFAGLVRDSAGTFYGTTLYGGIAGGCIAGAGCGVVFKVERAGSETVLHTFGGPPDGALPLAALVRDAVGNLFGTTWQGGMSGCLNGTCGVVFKLDASGNETVLYTFTGGADGGAPEFGALILDGTGNLYGTASNGGDNSCTALGCGVVFKVDPTGNETVLYAFTGGTDGGYPVAGLVRDVKGSLYGTTAEAGNAKENAGVVFKLSPTGTETVLHTFLGTDGSNPAATLLPHKGVLYGTTAIGGDLSGCGGAGCGVAFEVRP
jgi:uncharacterized repeat protein (TIGR03803 family)